ncbi:MAG: dihydroorotate dehydrogenase electron transfer subunit [candidate division Zixibacteria bacterium]|nr:dihydroorotate dehydrogenase electron transfer subunit [candidate division Zixibacteria bacterium]
MRKTIPQQCEVTYNRRLDKAGLYYRLSVQGFKSPRKIYPGQFIHVKVSKSLDPFFRRAFSIADYSSDGTLDIIYKIVGKGTSILRTLKKGDSLDIIGPLGNNFSRPAKSKTIILAAGGVGLPPLLYFSRYLIEKKHPAEKILFFYGGRSKDDLIEKTAIKKMKTKFYPSTDDGSFGFHGLITAAIQEQLANLDLKNTIIYGCGPEPMLNALQNLAMKYSINGEISLEAPMPCGVGVCLGCVKPKMSDPSKYVRVCYDGPIFKIGEVQL